MSENKENISIFQKIISIVASVLLVCSVLLCGFVVLQVSTKGRVEIFGYSLFHVETPSMEPTISVGALLTMHKCNIEDVKKNDIICFTSLESGAMNGQVITHRVVGSEEKDGVLYLHTRGDANNSEDGYLVSADNFLGKVVSYTEKGSFWLGFFNVLTSKKGFLLIIGIPVVLILGMLLKNSVGNMRAAIEEVKREAEEEIQGNQEKTTCGEESPFAMTPEEIAAMRKRIEEEVRKQLEEHNSSSGNGTKKD